MLLQFKALLYFPEGSIEDDSMLAVYNEDISKGSVGHCDITWDGKQCIGSFELTDSVSEKGHLRVLGYVDASNGLFIPERLVVTLDPSEDEGTLPLSALIQDDVPQD